MARLFLVVAAALILCGVASAATIDDLRALGYTVSNDGTRNGCTTYVVDGHSIHLFANTCSSDYQSTIDSLANPAGVCNADWQTNHPDQVQAFFGLSGKGWAISGDQCADRYTVTNPNDNTVAYSGAGAGLVSFNNANGSPPASAVTPGQPSTTPTPPSNCLPLCPNPGETRGAGGTVIPVTPAEPAATLPPNASIVYDAVTGEVASTRLMLRVGSAVAV